MGVLLSVAERMLILSLVCVACVLRCAVVVVCRLLPAPSLRSGCLSGSVCLSWRG